MCIFFNHLVLKVISMNMWGIHRDLNLFSRSRSKSIFRCESCEHRKERMIGAAEIIKSNQYDFIMFQVLTYIYRGVSSGWAEKKAPPGSNVPYYYLPTQL